MTKREFDKLTSWNYGTTMAGDTKCDYKRSRGFERFNMSDEPRDRLAERAYWRRRNPGIPVLGLASRFRAPVSLRLLGRFPHLPLNHHERVALFRGA